MPDTITENIKALFKTLPDGVELVAACKTRTPAEVNVAVAAGIKIIGENYMQEAETLYPLIGNRVRWHFIGTLQKNKVKTAVRLFDMIETLDSYALACEIEKHCAEIDKQMPVLLEINSGCEPQKSGLLPDDVFNSVTSISQLAHLKISGLMTMGPRTGEPELARPYFSQTRLLFEQIRLMELPGVKMRYLSMGMTNSYSIAIEEGANIVRIGSKIFGER